MTVTETPDGLMVAIANGAAKMVKEAADDAAEPATAPAGTFVAREGPPGGPAVPVTYGLPSSDDDDAACLDLDDLLAIAGLPPAQKSALELLKAQTSTPHPFAALLDQAQMLSDRADVQHDPVLAKGYRDRAATIRRNVNHAAKTRGLS